MSQGIPIKTALALVTFGVLILLPEIAPSLKDFKSLEARSIPAVLDFPLPRCRVRNAFCVRELRTSVRSS